MVANDPRFAELVKRDFVAVAASDVDYAHVADQDAWETRWVRDLLANAEHGLFQGIYLATPSGVLLGRADGGWPTYDPALARDDEVEIAVQILGKVKAKITVPARFRKAATRIHRPRKKSRAFGIL